MTTLTVKTFPFLSDSVFAKLRKCGYRRVTDIIVTDPSLIARKSDVPLNDVLALRTAAFRQQDVLLMNGDEFNEKTKKFTALFSTGIDSLDLLLGGGVFSGEIVEFMGPSASGKTQICLCLAAYTGVVAKQWILYIDTNGSFSAKRVKEIMQGHGVGDNEMETALCRIIVCHCFDLQEVFAVLDEEDRYTAQPTRLIIIDSITALILPHIANIDGLGLLNHLSSRLKSIAVQHHKAIVVTNSVVHWKNEMARPSLGRYWSYVPNVRIALSADDGLRERIATLEVSKTIEQGRQVKFKLTSVGGE